MLVLNFRKTFNFDTNHKNIKNSNLYSNKFNNLFFIFYSAAVK